MGEYDKVQYSFSDSYNITEEIKKAENSIFFTGYGLRKLSECEVLDAFDSINESIDVTLITADYEDDLVRDYCTRYWGVFPSTQPDPVEIDIEKSIIRGLQNRNLFRTNILMPVSYFAIDYKKVSEHSFIQAKHYLLKEKVVPLSVFKSKAVCLYITARPGADLYNQYREQLLLIERKKGKVGF